jgi:hypothetical protein
MLDVTYGTGSGSGISGPMRFDHAKGFPYVIPREVTPNIEPPPIGQSVADIASSVP